MMLKITVFLLFVFVSSSICSIFKSAPPIELEIANYGLCRQYKRPQDHLEVYYTDRKVDKYKRAYEGNATFDFPPHEVEFTVDAEVFKDGKWEKLMTLKEKDPLKLANTYLGEVWYKVEDNIDGIERGQYPIPPGTYSLREYIVDFDDLNRLPNAVRRFLIPGKYRGKLYVHHDGEEVMCGHGEGEIRPKT